ncbi:MbcA/ParS/Xre antitoxin family protein [Acuticoccus sp. M5D2P5]|uniref:MbcA/ParS/Xre antitoxin family protein n=1 Tax=Acuticoccus kalidii TaxID=2910977 RepID=UPI001F1DFD9B|nr:MbcA/ParS/Xre antitoxin family protein [Acuticoccus kalidii]MCF3935060.1 MbcA/ParS/Xre antitoxin family protein [Acuticoccus kalidii]
MEQALQDRQNADVRAVALKAFGRIADDWSLTVKEAAALADMSESTWKRARRPGFAGDLTRDQLLRLSALIGLYKGLELYFSSPIAESWVKRPNRGPEFDGRRPIDAMIEGGLPKILRVRTYIDALRGGV